jgi:hypothetical protein
MQLETAPSLFGLEVRNNDIPVFNSQNGQDPTHMLLLEENFSLFTVSLFTTNVLRTFVPRRKMAGIPCRQPFCPVKIA